MKEHTLAKTGKKRPFAFYGEEIFTGSNKDYEKNKNKWEEIRVIEKEEETYKEEEGKYAIGIAYRTNFTGPGEKDVYDKIDAKTQDEVLEVIARLVPDLDISELFNEKRTEEESISNQPQAS